MSFAHALEALQVLYNAARAHVRAAVVEGTDISPRLLDQNQLNVSVWSRLLEDPARVLR